MCVWVCVCASSTKFLWGHVWLRIHRHSKRDIVEKEPEFVRNKHRKRQRERERERERECSQSKRERERCVVYFDQQAGAVQPVGWLKYAFFADILPFFPCFAKMNRKTF